jgi:hypothetical protein
VRISSAEPGGPEELLGIPVLEPMLSELSDWAPISTPLVGVIVESDRGSSREKIVSGRLDSERLIGTYGAKLLDVECQLLSSGS